MEDPIDHREDAHGPATSLDRNDPDLRISARRVYAVLLVCIAGLVAAGVASSVLKFTYGYQSAFTLIPLFDLDREGNVPAWFSSLLLFSIALLLGIIGAGKAKSRDRWRWHWIGLAVIFVLLSMDEAASLHERLTVPLRSALDLSGALYFAWVVPAGALLIVFAAVYIRFLAGAAQADRPLVRHRGVFVCRRRAGGGACGRRLCQRLWA